jgi:hypothetical protein
MENVSIMLDEPKVPIFADAERQPCEVWTHVIGYFHPVSSFNRGKQGEYHEQKCFPEPKCD